MGLNFDFAPELVFHAGFEKLCLLKNLTQVNESR